MERDEKWAVIADQRRVLADVLDGRDEAQRNQPSLCSEWRVRDVAAHIALTPQSPGVLRILGMGCAHGAISTRSTVTWRSGTPIARAPSWCPNCGSWPTADANRR